MNRFKRIGIIAVMIMSLIAVPVMLILMVSPARVYGLYEGHVYEAGYWWQTVVFLGALNCICSRITRRRRDSVEITRTISLLSIIVVIAVVLTKSSWGVVKLLDSVGGGDATGVFLIWILPFVALLICCGYYTLGRFVAEKH